MLNGGARDILAADILPGDLVELGFEGALRRAHVRVINYAPVPDSMRLDLVFDTGEATELVVYQAKRTVVRLLSSPWRLPCEPTPPPSRSYSLPADTN